jgi:diaminopimelate epimerase
VTASDSTVPARRFWKMSGSGNDFVFFDARDVPVTALQQPAAIARLCDRRQGVGADGVVFLEAGSGGSSFRMAYYNSDGSRASMCGNAALCSTRLATALGAAAPAGFAFDSDVGTVRARLRDGLPEVDLSPVRGIAPDVAAIAAAPGEKRIGFALAGVPHLVVLCDDAAAVPLASRGAVLRRHPSLGEAGANANFVSRHDSGEWRMRTFERGVEGETLACGTGAVATAALLRTWGLTGAGDDVELTTASGLRLGVRLQPLEDGTLLPALRGQGRIVYQGELQEL